MKLLYLHFNEDGTIRTASLRIDSIKVPDMMIWELFELYNLLIEAGHKPIEMTYPEDGTMIHIIAY
jgi:hypothetical protein